MRRGVTNLGTWGSTKRSFTGDEHHGNHKKKYGHPMVIPWSFPKSNIVIYKKKDNFHRLNGKSDPWLFWAPKGILIKPHVVQIGGTPKIMVFPVASL